MEIDKNEIALSLIETVQELGEKIYIQQYDGSASIECYIAMETTMAKSHISGAKEYEFVGTMLCPEGIIADKLRGHYFTREEVPGKTYILMSTTETPYTDRLTEIYIAECNEKVDVAYKDKEEDPLTGDLKDVFVNIHEGVLVYSNTTMTAQQSTQMGGYPRNVINVIIPVAYPVNASNFVLRKEFVPVSKTDHTTIWGNQSYKVESIDQTFVDSFDESAVFGVLKIELTKDI